MLHSIKHKSGQQNGREARKARSRFNGSNMFLFRPQLFRSRAKDQLRKRALSKQRNEEISGESIPDKRLRIRSESNHALRLPNERRSEPHRGLLSIAYP